MPRRGRASRDGEAPALRKREPLPVEQFGLPAGGENAWMQRPSPAELKAAHAEGRGVMVASWEGWRPMKIAECAVSKDERELLGFVVETANGGRMTLSSGQTRASVLVRRRAAAAVD